MSGKTKSGSTEGAVSLPILPLRNSVLFPGLFLGTMVLSINILGDGIRDMLDPRIAKRI